MHSQIPYKPFLYTTALCSLLGALTTSLLIFLPNPPASDFEARVLLYDNSLYLSKLWLLFLHPQVNFLASLGVAYLLMKKHPLQIIFGTLFLAVWAYTEMTQQSLMIDALNQMWRPGYLEADSESVKSSFKTLMDAAGGISDSYYFLLLYGFGIGSLLFGLAMIHEPKLGKLIGWSLIFIGVLSLSSFLRYYLGQSYLNGIVNWMYKWIYTYLQPLVRVGIALWIFKEAKKLSQPT